MPFRRHQHTGRSKRRERDVTLASATLISRKQLRSATKAGQGWQSEAWDFYDGIGELRFAAAWRGNALSRCHLFIGTPDPEGGGDPSPAETPGLAADLLADLHYGQIGQGEMLRRMGIHLSIPGETFLIGMDPDPDIDGPDAERRWLVASTKEFGGGPRPHVTLPDTGEKRELDPDTATIIRIWNPHAGIAWESDSAVRANRVPLREVQALSRHVTATVDSRLAGAGVLCIPHSASMPVPRGSDDNGTSAPLHEDPFVDGLTTAMLTAIQDPDDASAVVPIVIRVPDESVGKIQHLTFSTPLDERAASMREAALRRFARGSDLPPEIIEGKADANHWSAWEISDDALRLYIEPQLATICDALTQQYLWPALRAAGEPNPEQYVIWYDSSELSQRPNRSVEAQALYDKGELSTEALLRENGFGDDDAPTDQERQRWLAVQLVQQQPALLPYLAEVLGFDVSAIPAIPAQSQRHLAPVDNQDDEPGADRPEPPQEPGLTADAQTTDDEWVLSTVEQGALRALELAGKKLVSRHSRSIRPQTNVTPAWNWHTIAAPQGLSDDHVDKLLDGAFEGLEHTVPDQPCLRDAAETHVRGLLRSGREHVRSELARVLSYSGCMSAA